ncbi:Alkaline ceramidase [Datura stramonium]|uniref:Alkaline ceramidase n=1 Tax=Datura stramonium TaxID=4076 RepID=A0ABS8VLL4_DATST|nr:Alkaline ceramidase [Datura stramonium]
MTYHATLRQMQQQGDETPMVWEMLYIYYLIFTRLALSEYDAHLFVPLWCTLCHCAFTDSLWHWFQSPLCTIVPSLRSSCIQVLHSYRRQIGKAVRSYMATLLIELLAGYVIDYSASKIQGWYVNPQGHAVWHALMGFNSYFANTFLMYCRTSNVNGIPKSSTCWESSHM